MSLSKSVSILRHIILLPNNLNLESVSFYLLPTCFFFLNKLLNNHNGGDKTLHSTLELSLSYK